MRSSDLFGFFLLFLLYFWRPAEGLCSLENSTTARCLYLDDVRYIDTYNLHALKASVAEKILTPAVFRNLTTLRHLDLSRGNLEEIYPGSFIQLPQLLSLNLADNHIEHLNSSSLEGLKNLQKLVLRRNNIHHLPEALLDLKNLKVLDISRNQLDCNCATLKVRDKLIERGVKILKGAVCSGPVGVKGVSLLKPGSKLICIFEEQDEGIQMDQPVVEDAEGSGELGSGDEESFDDDEGDFEEVSDTATTIPDTAETLSPETPVPTISETEPSTPEIPLSETTSSETPFSETPSSETPLTETVASEAPLEATQPTSNVDGSITSVSPIEVSLEKSKLKGDDGLFFDIDEKSSTENSPVLQTEKQTINDDLVSAIEGSGYDDEFEGSGTLVPPIDFRTSKIESVFENTEIDENKSDNTESLFDSMFGRWSDEISTTAPEEKTGSEIEQNEFLIVDSGHTTTTERLLPKNTPVGLIPSKAGVNQSDIVEGNGTISKNGEMKPEKADASSQDTKMGNGSMVILIVLLVIFVALVGFAAYKGDFCKKKRVSHDLERGTELREMQKSLLDGRNSVQPKINGNTESVPLINAPLPKESKEKETLNQKGNNTVTATPSAKSDPSTPAKSDPSTPAATETLDPVKPPRKTIPEETGKPSTNGKSNQEPCINSESKSRAAPLNLTLNDMKTPTNTPMKSTDFGSPPLSPDAQRVKIILQDNPDSVPKTPILITRTKMGENLVKTP